MEPLAENKFTITKKLFYEGTVLLSGDSYRNFAKRMTVVLLVLWLVLFLILLVARANLLYGAGELIAVAALCVWLHVLLPRSRARSGFRRLQRQGELSRTVRFYADHLAVESESRSEEIPYSRVKRLLQSRNLLILVCENRVGIMLALDGFSAGNAETVRGLLDRALP